MNGYLLRKSGWRFFDDEHGRANIALEANVKLKKQTLDDLGADFEKTANGFVDYLSVDYLSLDERGFPLAVLEAKSEKFDPLIGKEKARQYAHSQNARFVILSNGNLSYFWDLEHGNPTIITEFPRQRKVLLSGSKPILLVPRPRIGPGPFVEMYTRRS